MLSGRHMPGQGLLSEQGGEADSEQCKRKEEKAFSLHLFGDVLSISPLLHLPFLLPFVPVKTCGFKQQKS